MLDAWERDSDDDESDDGFAVDAAPPVEYPERPGAPECVFFVKTGRCKFGARCHFHHPKGVHG